MGWYGFGRCGAAKWVALWIKDARQRGGGAEIGRASRVAAVVGVVSTTVIYKQDQEQPQRRQTGQPLPIHSQRSRLRTTARRLDCSEKLNGHDEAMLTQKSRNAALQPGYGSRLTPLETTVGADAAGVVRCENRDTLSHRG